MKNAWLCMIGLMLLGMTAFGAHPAQAASGVGPSFAMNAWDQTIAVATRFLVLTNMSSQAVLDKETGLVWQQSPSTGTGGWEFAQISCNTVTTGNRMGWRLPTIQELESLIDPSQSNLALPIGHPFSNVQTGGYWTANTSNAMAGWAWGVGFTYGTNFIDDMNHNYSFWCVRGGKGLNPQ